MVTKVTIKKYPDGTSAVKKVVGKKSKPIDTYTRDTTTTYEDSPGSKGKLFIKEGTVQRKPSGKGVEFVADDANTVVTSTGKIIDPRSRKTESENQAVLRKMALASHQDVDLSKRYKEGDDITYQTKKGSQVAGRVQKTEDVPPMYSTSTAREIQISKRGDVRDSKGDPKLGKQYKDEGYVNQGGTYKYIKPDENKFIPEEELDQYLEQGYYRSDRSKKEVEKLKKGAKKMKIYKKGSKGMC